MKKFLPFVLCLSLSIFSVARAMKPAHALAPETAANVLVDDENTDEGVASDDDDSTEGASNDQGEDINDNDGGDAAADERTGDDNAGDDDGGDDGGGDKSE